MEQYAHQFYHEYQSSHPDEWTVEHITAPRQSYRARYVRISNMNSTELLRYGPVTVRLWVAKTVVRYECLVPGRTPCSFSYRTDRPSDLPECQPNVVAAHRTAVEGVLAYVAQFDRDDLEATA